MTPLDICYTPLDIPEVPEFNSDALHKWIDEIYNSRPTSGNPLENATLSEKTLANNYPWKKVYAYFSRNTGWQNGFDKLFPELAEYLFKAYDLSADDIEEITLLPTREDLVGWAFWHADRDPAGLRVYLENDQYETNCLYYRKTKVAYNAKQKFPAVVKDQDPMFEDQMIKCQQIKGPQGFYLNNIRGVHNYNVTSVPAKRIAVVIKMVTDNASVEEKIKNLIVNSAMKYKDHAVLY